jgi:hypothetical protein
MRSVVDVVDDERRDEPRDEPRDVPRHPDARRSRSSRRRAARRAEAPRCTVCAKKSTTSGATGRVTSHATCRGIRTHGVVEVVDDEPRDVPRHPYAQRRRSISVATARRVVMMHNGMTGHTARASATD